MSHISCVTETKGIMAVTVRDLRTALTLRGNSFPGPDGIPYVSDKFLSFLVVQKIYVDGWWYACFMEMCL